MRNFTRPIGHRASALIAASALIGALVLVQSPASGQTNAAPTLSRITANFVQADFSTYYTVSGTDPDGGTLLFFWHLYPPSYDLTCRNFEELDAKEVSPNRAVWHHGGAADGCSHSAQDQTANGHQGTVLAWVTDGEWYCTSSYFGSASGQSVDPGVCTQEPPPPAASNVGLCHGATAGSTCVAGDQSDRPGDEHEMTARVTDANGNPVPDVPVRFSESGPGAFTSGGDTATVTTDTNGLAATLLTSETEGASSVVAEISPPDTPGGFRGPGSSDDACETGGGNCVSQPLTNNWDLDAPTECSDAIDNDGDGYVDFGEDPGCVDDIDDDELPVNPPPEPVRHDRSISIRFNDGTGARNNGLVVFGRLRAPDFPDCRSAQPVKVQRRVSGRWVTKKSTITSPLGGYSVDLDDQTGRYRAVAPTTELLDPEDHSVTDVCGKAIAIKAHRH